MPLQDWREAIEEINRKVQDLTRRVYHDAAVEKVETANARIAAFDENAQRLQQAAQAIRTQLVNLPSGTEQTQAVVRRELVFYRNMLDATMRRLGVVENNIRVLNEMNTRVMGQLADLEGHVDDAADMIQVAQQNPRGPQGRPNVGYDAFAGQGHRIRSPTPTSGDRNAQNPVPSARPGGGVSLTDHVFEDSRRANASDQPQVNRGSILPGVPSRVDAGSHANRRPVSPVREREDSRQNVSISPNRDESRNRSPRAADREPPGDSESWR